MQYIVYFAPTGNELELAASDRLAKKALISAYYNQWYYVAIMYVL